MLIAWIRAPSNINMMLYLVRLYVQIKSWSNHFNVNAQLNDINISLESPVISKHEICVGIMFNICRTVFYPLILCHQRTSIPYFLHDKISSNINILDDTLL